MKSMNDWIPTAVFIEHFVLNEALERNVSIEKASSLVLPTFGINPDGAFLHRQTRLLSLLYTLIVFPREQWKRIGLLEVAVERAKIDPDLSPEIQKILDIGFLRAIRNSVAHARIQFDSGHITFRDGHDDKPPTFDITMTESEALNLALVLGRAFHESAQVKDKIAKIGS